MDKQDKAALLKWEIFAVWLKTVGIMYVCNVILSVVIEFIMSGFRISFDGVLVYFLFLTPYYLRVPCVIVGVIAYLKLLRKDQERAFGIFFASLTPLVYVAIVMWWFNDLF